MYKQLNEATVFCDKYCKHARVIVDGGPAFSPRSVRQSHVQTETDPVQVGTLSAVGGGFLCKNQAVHQPVNHKL